MIDGIEIKRNENNVYLCIINEFSQQLKELIRTNLSRICYGPERAECDSLMYSYRETLREFLKRYESKDANAQKGMIGELLSHIVFLRCNSNLNSINPFFNMEERSIKKGFDILFVDVNYDDKYWIAEVKSGELGNFSCSKEKNYSLLNKAKKDLEERLNDQDRMIWRNAINGARIANKSNLKEEVVKILEETVDEGIENEFASDDKNVILTSVLFNDIQDCIKLSNVESKKQEFIEEDLFKEIMVFSIQKNTYEAIESFLREEASDE